MLTPILKSQVYHRLSAITSNNIIVMGIRQGLQKRPIDYVELAQMVKDQIKDNAPEMNIILGADNLVFFKKLNLD